MKRRLYNIRIAAFKNGKFVAAGMACSFPIRFCKVHERYVELMKFRTKLRSGQTADDLEVFQYVLLPNNIIITTSIFRAVIPNAQLKLCEEISFSVVEADVDTINPHGTLVDNLHIQYDWKRT